MQKEEAKRKKRPNQEPNIFFHLYTSLDFFLTRQEFLYPCKVYLLWDN